MKAAQKGITRASVFISNCTATNIKNRAPAFVVAYHSDENY
jgi:hypothetical protein